MTGGQTMARASDVTREQVLEAIRDAIERLNELREPDERLEWSEETLLYGSEGNLDSLGLVALILDLEETLSARTARTVVLADERAMAEGTPFRSVSSLADHVMESI